MVRPPACPRQPAGQSSCARNGRRTCRHVGTPTMRTIAVDALRHRLHRGRPLRPKLNRGTGTVRHTVRIYANQLKTLIRPHHQPESAMTIAITEPQAKLGHLVNDK